MATRLFRFSIAFAPVLYGRLSYVEYRRYVAPTYIRLRQYCSTSHGPSAGKLSGPGPNFAITAFYEVRYRKQRPSNNKDTLFGGYAAASKPCTLSPLANRGGGPKYPFFLRLINERVAPTAFFSVVDPRRMMRA
jgi:hypothetical protein